MKDQYGRTVDYLRLSVTDLCNYRCRYCMPPEGVEKLPHSSILSLEEYVEIAAAAVELGITKIRVTGGEPLVRRGIVELCRGASGHSRPAGALPHHQRKSLTALAAPLRDAGVDRLNISLDTLHPEHFRAMTRTAPWRCPLRNPSGGSGPASSSSSWTPCSSAALMTTKSARWRS